MSEVKVICEWAYQNDEPCTMTAYQDEPYCYQHLIAYREADFDSGGSSRQWAAVKLFAAQEIIDQMTRTAEGVDPL